MAKKPVPPPNAEFVGRVVGDAKNPPETRMLSGWFGDAAEEGYRRLYTDAELSAYVDIPTDAILYTEPIRDVQPSGGVFVWVKRDAELKPGGSAASRAARFLQGQVQQDFSSPEKAGFRCVTEVPCGEPTGFTGQCTKQPEVGGAWPCITAIPLCAAEPTGFTGKCTDLPWPNPTHYLGCTYLHCPTKDLTHIPHICHIVATGLPGCPVVDPRGGGIDPAAKASAAEEGKEGGGAADRAAVPSTSIPGCGYTQTWGLCETQLLSCGFTKQGGQQCPTQLLGCGQTKDCPTALPGCGWSKNPICTDLPGCGWTRQWGLCQHTQPPKCGVSVDTPCITQTETPQCQVARGGFAAFGAAARGPGGAIIDTQQIQCNPSAVDACPSVHGPGCLTAPPTAFCTEFPEACPTKFPPVCPQTAAPETCPPTSCGPQCQTQQHECTLMSPPCTQAGPQCPTYPSGDCTFFGCPSTPGAVCTQSGPQCPSQFGSGCHTDMKFDCTFGCTQQGTGCPVTTPEVNCGHPRAFAAAGPAGPIGPTAYRGCTWYGPQCRTYPAGDCTFFGCPPFTRTFQCGGGPSAVDACPTRLCGGGQQFFGAAARPAQGLGAGPVGTFFTLFEVRCVAPDTFFDVQCQPGPPTSPPQCPHTAQAECQTRFCQPASQAIIACTIGQPGCPPPVFGTAAGPQCQTVPCPPQTGHPLVFCTAFGPGCPPLEVGTAAGPQCRAAVGALAGGGGAHITPLTVLWQCQPPTPATHCFICPPYQHSPLPWYCPPITQTFHCGGGPSAVDACPTRLCGGGGQQFFGAARAVQDPTPATVCFICTQVPRFCPIAQ